MIAKNPTELVSKPVKNKPAKRALSKTEIGYIEKAELDKKSKAFVYTLLYAGLRRGEALALTKGDIDLNEKTISVNKNLITVGNAPEIKPSPKSKAGNRVISIPDTLVGILTDYIKDIPKNYVFPSANGALMSATSFRRFWEKVINALNLAAGPAGVSRDITPHIFRHTYATMLYYAGVDIKTAQYLLGHASVNLTMEIYTHLDNEKIKMAADKFNTFISSSQEVVND